MSDRSGCSPVELAVLETLDVMTAGRPRAYIPSAKALAAIEERIRLGPRYANELLLDLGRPWVTPVRTVAVAGNYGDRRFPSLTEPDYTEPDYAECRPSHAGRLVLDAEAHRRAPVPVGLINGTAYRGGTQPPLEPFRVLAALRRVLDAPRVPDGELTGIVGPPYSVTGCTVTGDIRALTRGRRVVLRESGRITITGVAVPQAPAEPPPAHDVQCYGLQGEVSAETFPAHLVIESLPATTLASEVALEIARRAASRPRPDPYPGVGRRTTLPIARVDDQSRDEVRIVLTLRPGSDPAAVRDKLATIRGVSAEAARAYPAPLASLLRSWVNDHRSEDIATSLNELENSIRRDRQRERRNR
jgi:hypothetical protein